MFGSVSEYCGVFHISLVICHAAGFTSIPSPFFSRRKGALLSKILGRDKALLLFYLLQTNGSAGDSFDFVVKLAISKYHDIR